MLSLAYTFSNQNHYYNFSESHHRTSSSPILRTFLLFSYRKGPTTSHVFRLSEKNYQKSYSYYPV